MNDIRLRDRLYRAALLCASALLLLACNKEAGGLPPDKTAAQITAYNHTADYIHQFYVDDAWGGNAYAYVGGGFVCCVVYPRKWYPELKVTVRWTTSSSDPKATGDEAKEHWHETIVPIEQYDKPGLVQVHFLPDHKVRVIVSEYGAGHPDYPGPRSPEKPSDFKW